MKNTIKKIEKSLSNFKIDDSKIYKIKGHSIESLILLAYRLGKNDARTRLTIDGCLGLTSAEEIQRAEQKVLNSCKQDLWEFWSFAKLNS